jgi:HK97 family phage major capsid protein
VDEKELKKLTDDLNTSFEKLQKDLEKKADADVLTKKMDEITGKLGLLADKEYAEKMQKQVDQIALDIKELGTRQGKGEKSVSEQVDDFLKSDDYKTACKNKTPIIKSVKANEITTSNSFTQTAEPLIQSYRDPIIGVQPRMNLAIWNLVSKAFTNSDLVSVAERTSETSGAAARTEIAAAGQSYAGWTVTNHSVRDIAEHMKVSRNKLEDTDFIRSEIMEMLDYHIPAERERQMLLGLSANSELLGLINTTAAVAKVFAKPSGFDAVTAANRFDVLLAAILQVALGNTATTNRTGFQANGIVVNPVDAANMKLLKDGENRYLMVPFAPTGFTVDGVPVYVSNFITAGSFLVGDFTRAKAYMRRDLEIRMAEQHDTDFTHNLVTFLATQRLAFVVKANVDAYAFVYGTFSAGINLISA